MALRQRPPATAPTAGRRAPIQVVPPGLLGLLQLKSLGAAPQELADGLQSVLELRDWYLTARRVGTVTLFGGTPTRGVASGILGNSTFTPPAGGLAVVPQNQIWYVEQLVIFCDPTGAETATDTVRFCPGILSPNGEALQVGPDLQDVTLAARTRTLRARADRGFWAFPGDQFITMIFDNVTTNGWTFSLNLRATPCQL